MGRMASVDHFQRRMFCFVVLKCEMAMRLTVCLLAAARWANAFGLVGLGGVRFAVFDVQGWHPQLAGCVASLDACLLYCLGHAEQLHCITQHETPQYGMFASAEVSLFLQGRS